MNDRAIESGWMGVRRLLAAVVAVLALGACRQKPLPLPTPAKVRSYYDYKGSMKVDMSGNVAEITVYQTVDELRRGGTLWAKVGPYIFLFTDDTQKLFHDFPGLAAVRVITRLPRRGEIARALLPRDTLSDVTWDEALNVDAYARAEGTEHPERIADLVQWGEDHTRFKYNHRYVPGG